MRTPVWLTAAIARTPPVNVCVRLDGDPTVFVDADAALPSGHHLMVGDASTVSSGIVLSDFLLALWPAASERVEVQIKALATIDNRLDLEADLQSTAALLAELIKYWRALDSTPQGTQRTALGGWRPDLVEILDQASLGVVAELPPSLSDPFEARPLETPVIDDEHWAAWTARSSEEIFGPGGGLARLLGDGYESREGQLHMADRVAKALSHDEHLMVEAGTGIGKSLAYLVPALLHGARHGERVVVSTYTRTLQSQLVEHDLPLLERLGYPGRVRLLLGRTNYLCRRQLRRAMRTSIESREQALAQFALALWSQQSVEGRLEELTDHPWFERHWRRFFESVEPCSPHICHRDPVCFVVRARRVARDAPVVIVNHSLLMMDLKSGQSLVGPSRLLVVDEAHHLSQVATRGLSHWIAPERLEVYRNLCGERLEKAQMREVLAHLLRAAKGDTAVHDAALETDRSLDEFLSSFSDWFAGLNELALGRLGAESHRMGSHRVHDGAEAFGPLSDRSDRFFEAGRRLETALAQLVASSGEREESGAAIGEEREALASLLEAHREFVGQVRFCIAADDEDWVYWFEWGGEAGLRAVICAPLTVELPLSKLWDSHYRSVVMTSATLAVETDFLPFAESVGFSKVERFTDSLQVSSPFDPEHQSLLLTALDLPAPDDPAFAPRVADVVATIATSVKTKILVLSTSYRFVDQLEAQLRERILGGEDDLFATENRVVPQILAQRPGIARHALADRFRRAEAAILIATGSFWEGVDFPGRQLEVLVVPRLPFAVPTDPLVEGRTERARRMGRDPFQDVTLVDAVLRLKQGVGRLLRTQDDRGAVLLLDQRLQSRSYGVRFLNSMPRLCEMVPELDDVARRTVEFLGGRARSR